MSVSFNLENNTLKVSGALERFYLGDKRHYQFPKVAQSIDIDLTKVVSVDTAGLAWLLKLVSFYQQHRLTVKISNVPEQLIALAGISNVLELLPIESK